MDTIPSSVCHFCSYNAIENEAHFVLEYPLYNPIRDKFPSIFQERSSREPQVFLLIRPTSEH